MTLLRIEIEKPDLQPVTSKKDRKTTRPNRSARGTMTGLTLFRSPTFRR
ncbi:MAG: hypothetical protein GYB64_07730 [Chloroflexi bacterium]|nr:hypothetical protein [Chloroflexota bacterium]